MKKISCFLLLSFACLNSFAWNKAHNINNFNNLNNIDHVAWAEQIKERISPSLKLKVTYEKSDIGTHAYFNLKNKICSIKINDKAYDESVYQQYPQTLEIFKSFQKHIKQEDKEFFATAHEMGHCIYHNEKNVFVFEDKKIQDYFNQFAHLQSPSNNLNKIYGENFADAFAALLSIKRQSKENFKELVRHRKIMIKSLYFDILYEKGIEISHQNYYLLQAIENDYEKYQNIEDKEIVEQAKILASRAVANLIVAEKRYDLIDYDTLALDLAMFLVAKQKEKIDTLNPVVNSISQKLQKDLSRNVHFKKSQNLQEIVNSQEFENLVLKISSIIEKTTPVDMVEVKNYLEQFDNYRSPKSLAELKKHLP